MASLPFLRQAWFTGNRLNGRIPEEWCARYAATNRYELLVNIIDNPQVCLYWGVHIQRVVCTCNINIQ